MLFRSDTGGRKYLHQRGEEHHYYGCGCNRRDTWANDTWYLREATNRASKIVCLSNEMIRNVISLCPESNGKTIIIPNEYEGNCVKINFHNLSDKIVIGTAASHLNEKKV